ncbi:MAG: type II toxin-antitoxin system VapC family toxin [Alphaproteobacteria bacterium]
MRFLLDTHVLLWWRDASPLLSPRAAEKIAAGENEVLVSIASLWEITIKRRLGKLVFAGDFETVLNEERFGLLGVSLQHLRCLDTLPLLHRDPFDRLLIAQALAEHVPIITGDSVFAAYGAMLIW